MANTPTSTNTSRTISWSTFFKQNAGKGNDNNTEANKLILGAEPSSYAGNTTALYNHVEALQETAGLLTPTANKSIRAVHHCFTDLTRERIIGVQGLQKYAPFKEVAADLITMAFRPPLTRESSKAKIPTFEDFAAIKTADEFNNLNGSGEKDVEQLREMSATAWVPPRHLVRYYDKVAKAGDIAAKILSELPNKEPDEDIQGEALILYNQLVFLWAVDQGFASALPFKDPPNSDTVQTTVESINDLLIPNSLTRPTTGGRDQTALPNPRQDQPMDEAIGQEKDNTRPRTKQRGPTRESGRDNNRSEESGSVKNSGSDNEGSLSPSPPSRRRRNHNDDMGYGRRRSGGSRSRSQSRRRDHYQSERGNHHHGSRGRSPSRSPARRRRSRSPPRRSRSYQDSDLVTALVQGVAKLTKGQLETSARERKKASVLSRLSHRQTFLFDALSAEGWRDYHPRKSREAELLLEDRDVERNWNLLVDMSEEWPGGVSKPAFVQFFTKGYVSQERPGGFTAFMFSPPTRSKQGKKDRKRNLRNVLGKKSDVDEEDLEYYAKNAFHIPKSIYEGETQIKMSILLLDLLTNYKSISSDGYRYGLEFLDRRRSLFHDEQAKDKMFIARYVNLLDTTFQRFATDLGRFHDRKDPIREARNELKGRMEGDIRRVMRDIDLDIMPNLPLPPRLTEQEQEIQGGPGPSKRKKLRDPDTPGSTTTDNSPPPDWWKTNPSPKTEWALPSGKTFKDFFDPGTTAGRLNLAMFPKAKHHSPKVALKRSVCARYQCEGTCKPACNQAHLVPSRMTEEVRAETAAAFTKAYS